MPASKEQQWTPEEDNLIRDLVKQGMQLKDMPSHLPRRSRRAIECRVYNLGLKSGQPRLKYSKDESFWETPNMINCYYAGLAAADMSIQTTGRYMLLWECHSEDEQYMHEFIKRCKYTGTLFNTLDKSPRSSNIALHSQLRIGACQKWATDLARNFHIVPDKAYRLRPPEVSSDLLRCCFLIGYTDGDGCIHVNKNNIAHLHYVSASLDIIQWIREFADQCFPYRMRDRRRKVISSLASTYHNCNIYGIQAVKIFEFLRKIDVPRFARKWDSPAFLALCDQYHNKWPEMFVPEMEPSFDSSGNLVIPALQKSATTN